MKKKTPLMIKQKNGWRHGIKGKIYSYPTGKIPFKYFRGNIYIMVMYDHDSNYIPTEAMKNRA